MKSNKSSLRGFSVITVVLTCLAVQAVFSLPAYGDEIVAWGGNNYGKATPPLGNDFTAIAAGSSHGQALKADGSIVAWGNDYYGLTMPPAGNDFTAVDTHYAHSLALRSDGSIVGWGRNDFGQAAPPPGNDFTAIAAGYWHSLALKSDGSIVGWGPDTGYGETTPPAGNDFTAIDAGNALSLALKADGSIVGWGDNRYGQATPPTGNDFIAIAVGAEHCVALKSNGSIVAWGSDSGYGETTPPAGNDFTAIAARNFYNLALKSDGSIVGWGYNNRGQATPPTGNDFTAIAAGTSFGLALGSVPQNSPPVADAGPDQTPFVTELVTLDGSGSTDLDGDQLTFLWSFISRPSGSTATLSDPTAVKPTFIVDKPGTYIVQLIVNDGTVDSDPDTVNINTQNSAPVADAGPDQSGLFGDIITLDGTGSSDVDGDPLTYDWALTTKPAGSLAELSDPAAAKPTFDIDVSGDYVAQLIVNDGTEDSAPDTVTITTLNTAPVADAGPDQSGLFGDIITLDGTGSSDVDGDPLTYDWALTTKPAGSLAELSDPAAAKPTFDIDVSGDYVAQLIVNDGTEDSAPDTVTITTLNTAPVADAGPDQSGLFGDIITLDGTGSSDVDGDPLTYDWALTTKPAGSLAELSDPAAAKPTFDIDVSGDYVAQLIVNDGTEDSAPDTVTITTLNTAPVADAGPDQSGLFGDIITLDGTGSSDVDGNPLTYDWALTTKPAGSLAELSDPAAAKPTFDIDVSGDYVAQLIVNDGTEDSAPDTVTITTLNTAPVADAGPDQSGLFGDIITLDGTGSSDVDGNPLTYDWALTTKPAGSLAELSDPAAAKPTFDIDVSGDYVAQLIVNDGTEDSAPDTVTITTLNTAPVADAGPDQSGLFGDIITLDGTGSSDVDGDPLTYDWALTTKPAGSLAELSDPAAAKPTFDIDVSGDYVAQLIVNDGTEDSAPDTVTITTLNTAPVADAGPDQSGLFGDIITLDGTGSSDVDGDPLTYDWALTTKPAGSLAELSDPAAAKPTFDIDVSGDYVAQLIVNDGTEDSAPDTVTITTLNTAPVADAGPDQSGLFGDIITLDGTGSSDVDGDPLTYDWALTTKPAGSLAELSDPAAAKPTFDIDVSGDYVAQLIVNDGTEDSAPNTVTITTLNTAPVADAGPDQSGLFGDIITLDGTGSSDVDGNPLTYDWALTTKPAGSLAELSDPAAAKPTFDIDVSGDYVAQLIVNDGTEDSAPDTVTITTLNTAPIAEAGPDQSVYVGDTVTLDGSDSTDVDGNPLIYKWSLTAKPVGSAAVLSDSTAAKPTFVIDVYGDYVAQLIVNDGSVDSTPDTVTISMANTAPVADAGPDQTPFATEEVILDGSGSSDADGDPLNFFWSLISIPSGSTATLSDPAAVNPSFVVDLPGTYVAQLIVNDSIVNSDPDTVTIITQNSAPVIGDIIAPLDPIQVNTPFDIIADFSDLDIGDTHTAEWNWGDNSTSGGTIDEVEYTVGGNHAYSIPGVYTITLTVADDASASDQAAFRYVVVYDPEGGFVTGGGWIDSPVGAYVPDPTLIGKANFGFVSKYKKGTNIPTGETEFNFKVADLNFHSDSYDWLVVAGHKAKYKGTGTINSSGNYGFMLSAIDENLTPSTDVDLFRIKIWDKDNGDEVVYDNQMDAADDEDPTTAIGGGNIKIHKGK